LVKTMMAADELEARAAAATREGTRNFCIWDSPELDPGRGDD
jgi:hypothetical protein